LSRDFSAFSRFFHAGLKRIGWQRLIYGIGGVMRHERMLGKHVWYLVSTMVNIGEPLFQLPWVENLLYRVLRDAKGIFSFEMCGLKFDGATLMFYIKPADGKELPKIMQRMMNFVHDELRSLSRRSRCDST
jgi:hypothetical protein